MYIFVPVFRLYSLSLLWVDICRAYQRYEQSSNQGTSAYPEEREIRRCVCLLDAQPSPSPQVLIVSEFSFLLLPLPVSPDPCIPGSSGMKSEPRMKTLSSSDPTKFIASLLAQFFASSSESSLSP